MEHSASRRLSFEQLEDRRVLAVFTVTDLSDAPVTMAGEAPGTLRQAIFDANALPDADVLQFDPGLNGTINLSVVGDTALGASAFSISSEITIVGSAAGITIRRDPSGPEMRLFHVASSGDLTLESIALRGGIARGPSDGEGRGGAIFNAGNLEIHASTLHDNQAVGGNAATSTFGGPGLGGAVFNDDGAVLIVNATLSGNSVQSGTGPSVSTSFGGGVYTRNGTLSIYNSTITNSTAPTGRGVYALGIGTDQTAFVEIYSSIIAQADAPAQARDLVAVPDAGGDVSVSGANNLIRTQNDYHAITVATDDPLLASLGSNGGPTLTHALPDNSPAIDQGINPRSLATDQRGSTHARLAGEQVDIGALERQIVGGPELPGDYSGNGLVDAADYVLWRKSFGAQVPEYSGADGSGNGEVDAADYDVWRENFGAPNLAATTARFTSVSADTEGSSLSPSVAAISTAEVVATSRNARPTPASPTTLRPVVDRSLLIAMTGDDAPDRESAGVSIATSSPAKEQSDRLATSDAQVLEHLWSIWPSIALR